MQNIETYRNENKIDLVSSGGEEIGRYKTLLDQATERFISRLENIEKKCSDTHIDAETLFNETHLAMLDIGLACAQFENEVDHDKKVIHDAAKKFRERTHPMISKSHFLNHGRTWPNGYPGDHKIIEAIYKRAEMSGGIGFYLDKYFLFAITLTVAVRGRKERLHDLLQAELAQRKNPRILDVACGSCREVFELAAAIQESGATVTCIDSDPEALSFSKQEAQKPVLRMSLSWGRTS